MNGSASSGLGAPTPSDSAVAVQPQRAVEVMPALVSFHVRLGEAGGRLFVLHLLWCLGCLAGGIVFGVAPATAAVNAVVRRDMMTRALGAAGESPPRERLWLEFWHSWRAGLVKANALGAVLLAGWALLWADRWVLRQGGAGEVSAWVSGIIVVLSLLWTVMSILAWPVAAHFDEPLPRLLRLVTVLSLSRPLRGLGALLVAGVWLWLWTAYPGLVPVFGVVLPAWCVSWIYWRAGVFPLPSANHSERTSLS